MFLVRVRALATPPLPPRFLPIFLFAHRVEGRIVAAATAAIVCCVRVCSLLVASGEWRVATGPMLSDDHLQTVDLHYASPVRSVAVGSMMLLSKRLIFRGELLFDRHGQWM